MKTIHVRTKTHRKGGNQFYKDKRIFKASTLCGLSCTDRDITVRQAKGKSFVKDLAWFKKHGFKVCDDCLRLVWN